MDLVLLASDARLQAFITRHNFTFVKLEPRAWGSYALGIQHYTERVVVYNRPFGSAWKENEAGAIALYEFVENNQLQREEIQVLLGPSGINELTQLIDEIKRTPPVRQEEILPIEQREQP